MSSGRLFHRYGPACAKALSPHVLVDLGMIRAREVDERKFRSGMYGWTKIYYIEGLNLEHSEK